MFAPILILLRRWLEIPQFISLGAKAISLHERTSVNISDRTDIGRNHGHRLLWLVGNKKRLGLMV